MNNNLSNRNTITDMSDISITDLREGEISDILIDALGNDDATNNKEGMKQVNRVICSETINSPALGITGNAFQMKIIAQAVAKYMKENATDNNFISDAIFSIELEYKQIYNLGEDNWGLAKEHEGYRTEKDKEHKEKLTLDVSLKSIDPILMDMVRTSIVRYQEDSGISKTDMERSVVDYITASHGENDIELKGPVLQMKVISEAIKHWNGAYLTTQDSSGIYKERLEILDKIVKNIDGQYEVYALESKKIFMNSGGYAIADLKELGTKYRNQSVPMNVIEDVKVKLSEYNINRLLEEKVASGSSTFTVGVNVEANINILAISPRLAVPMSRSLVNEEPWSYIGEVSVNETDINQDSESQAEHDENILNHKNFKNITQYTHEEAIRITKENVSNAKVGDLDIDLGTIWEGDSVNEAIDLAVMAKKTTGFLYGLSKETLKQVTDIDGNLDSQGTSVDWWKEGAEKGLYAWIIKADNSYEMIEKKKKIITTIIEVSTKDDLDELVGTSAISDEQYRNYVLNTAKDPLDKYPHEVEYAYLNGIAKRQTDKKPKGKQDKASTPSKGISR